MEIALALVPATMRNGDAVSPHLGRRPVKCPDTHCYVSAAQQESADVRMESVS